MSGKCLSGLASALLRVFWVATMRDTSLSNTTGPCPWAAPIQPTHIAAGHDDDDRKGVLADAAQGHARKLDHPKENFDRQPHRHYHGGTPHGGPQDRPAPRSGRAIWSLQAPPALMAGGFCLLG